MLSVTQEQENFRRLQWVKDFRGSTQQPKRDFCPALHVEPPRLCGQTAYGGNICSHPLPVPPAAGDRQRTR
ncbi:hypothetical protein TNCT1_60790 [Streptomyces sp. 1-11]|nr:hypothetical protein TNCT1_60790 [Streptomyces sp. 1-11]